MKAAARQRFYCNPGSAYAEQHAIRIDENGHKTLVLSGEKVDIRAKIISHMDECDIEALLARSEIEGDEVLNRREAIYGDITLVPKSLLEAQIELQNRENEFNMLPLDIRKQFNFSFSEYIAEAGNNIESWASKMGYVKEQTKEEPTPEKGDEE